MTQKEDKTKATEDNDNDDDGRDSQIQRQQEDQIYMHDQFTATFELFPFPTKSDVLLLTCKLLLQHNKNNNNT